MIPRKSEEEVYRRRVPAPAAPAAAVAPPALVRRRQTRRALQEIGETRGLLCLLMMTLPPALSIDPRVRATRVCALSQRAQAAVAEHASNDRIILAVLRLDDRAVAILALRALLCILEARAAAAHKQYNVVSCMLPCWAML